MKMTITPGRPLKGEIALPGDKSLSHRAALLAALAYGESCIENFLVSGVTRVMLEALTSLGVRWKLEEGLLCVQGEGLNALKPPQAPLNCGNSATTLRLLAGALAGVGLPAVLDGSSGLRRRPMERILTPLRQMGVEIDAENNHAPLTLRGGRRPLNGIDHTLTVASAQVKTCLLLAGLAAGSPTTLTEPGFSRDHTEHLLRGMGVEITSERSRQNGSARYLTRLQPLHNPLALKPLALTLPGDFSAAAFLIVAALVTPGSSILLRGVGLNPTRTGLLDALLAMGAGIRITAQANRGGEAVGDLLVEHSRLQATRISGEEVVRMIDEFPIFAVAAAFAEGETCVRDAAELRLKESDRISAIGRELGTLGVMVTETGDGFNITGGQPGGGRVQPHADHRLAMAMAVAGLAASAPVVVEDAGVTGESYPDFAGALKRLGADVVVEA